MKVIEINNRFYNFPECWNELTIHQLVEVLSIFDEEESDNKKYLKLVKALCGISKWRFLFATADELSEYFYLVEFLLQSNTLTKNVLPLYKGLYGPDDGISNLIVEEYIFSETYYLQYKEAGKAISNLNCLVAILYRAGKKRYNHSINPDGDNRQAFNSNVIDLHASRINKWPLKIKLAILHYYEGCRADLVEAYSEVFTGPSGEPAKRGMLSVALSMAEGGMFGTLQQVEQLNIHTFLIGCDEALEKTRKLNSITPAV